MGMPSRIPATSSLGILEQSGQVPLTSNAQVMKKNVSYAQPLLEVIHSERNKANDDSELRGMFKQMNSQMIEQKIVVAKINKLCLGALTSIEHLAKKMKGERRSE